MDRKHEKYNQRQKNSTKAYESKVGKLPELVDKT